LLQPAFNQRHIIHITVENLPDLRRRGSPLFVENESYFAKTSSGVNVLGEVCLHL
jgi:hypothetical protein